MEICFWGVRGSIPAPGPETNRYGGNTPCVSVRTASGALVILDLGTGLIKLGKALLPTEFGKGQGQATVLLSHAHWDHLQGFPFFTPVFIPGNVFQIYGMGQSSGMIEGLLEGQMNPHFSPLYTLKNLGARVEFQAILPGKPIDVAGVHISCVANPHGSTTALAFRVEEQGRALVYAPDAGYGPEGPPAESLALYHGADVLIHDSTHTPEDRPARIGRGFSSVTDAVDAAVRAQARRLVLFHYDQDYNDDQVDALVARGQEAARGRLEVLGAAEGMTLSV